MHILATKARRIKGKEIHRIFNFYYKTIIDALMHSFHINDKTMDKSTHILTRTYKSTITSTKDQDKQDTGYKQSTY